MRRILLGSLGVAALFVGAPGSALARSHSHSHHRSHHAAKVRFEHFGPHIASSSSSTSSGATGPTGATTTTTPSQDAGTVVSLTNNVLTIKLNDGSSVSGLVDSNTRIQCLSATAQTADAGGSGDSGDGNGGGSTDGNSGAGDSNTAAQSDDDNTAQNGDDNGDQSDDQQAGDGGGQTAASCNASSLIAGAVVHEAELRVSSGGSQFTTVVLSQ